MRFYYNLYIIYKDNIKPVILPYFMTEGINFNNFNISLIQIPPIPKSQVYQTLI